MNISQSGGVFQPQTLEVDERIFDKNLRIIDDDDSNESHMPHFLRHDQHSMVKETKRLLPEPELPSLQVCPDPGICVKTKNVEDKKMFINVCKIQAIPPARPITEQALQSVIASEDYTADYRIPMSLGAPRVEKDKSGNDCLVCDVAVNSVWYDETMVNSLTFTTFLIHLAMEGLCDKYGDSCNMDRQNWNILKNKRYMGKQQRHVIQQRANASKIQEVLKDGSATAAPIGDMMTPTKTTSLIMPMKSTPEITLLKEPADSDEPDILIATVELPQIVTKDEISLELGQDRLLLSANDYALDIFLPFMVIPDESSAQFNHDKRVLTITMRVD
jgi:hypothetical protein